MADLTITAANVVAGSGADIESGTAGATITAGQTVYKNATTGRYALADADETSPAAARQPRGIALNGASDGQPLQVHRDGRLNIGATLTPGTAYYLSPNPGGIAPLADVLSGDDIVLIGLAASASDLLVKIVATGVQA